MLSPHPGNVSLLTMETSETIYFNRLGFKKTPGISLSRLRVYREGLIRGGHLVFTSSHFDSQRSSSCLCQYSHAWKSPHSPSPTRSQLRKPEGVRIYIFFFFSFLIFSSTDHRPFVKHKMWIFVLLSGSSICCLDLLKCAHHCFARGG